MKVPCAVFLISPFILLDGHYLALLDGQYYLCDVLIFVTYLAFNHTCVSLTNNPTSTVIYQIIFKLLAL